MTIRASLAVLALTALALLASSAVADEKDKIKEKPKSIKPDNEWAAVINDDKLSKEAPKDGIITDAKTFEKLWKAWRKDEKVPKIDFDKKIVVVTASPGGPNKPGTSRGAYQGGGLHHPSPTSAARQS